MPQFTKHAHNAPLLAVGMDEPSWGGLDARPKMKNLVVEVAFKAPPLAAGFFTLYPAEIDCLFRQDPSTNRDGGFQSLLVKLQKQTNRSTGVISLYTRDMERISRYAFDYGNGGWENRLLGIFSRTLGNRLGR